MLKVKNSKYILGPALAGFLLIAYSLYIPLPTLKSPTHFYSTHNRSDLKLTLLHTLKKAQKSIYLHTYALTDLSVLSLLKQKAQQGVNVHLFYHQKNTPKLHRLESSNFHFHPIKGKGLMHEKIWIIDEKQVFLGSANLTYSSLKMHENFILGIYSTELATTLIHSRPEEISIPLENQTLHYFSLPSQKALEALLKALDQAQKKVVISLFTFTHPQIVEKLRQLHQRGVQIVLTVDSYTARGASRSALTRLYKSGVSSYLSVGPQLFHHKWALIDSDTFILGSANWTQAAFKKNRDFILFLSPLNKIQIKNLNKDIKEIKNNNNIVFNLTF